MRANKGILCDLLRVGVITEEAMDRGGDFPLVTRDDFDEGALVSGAKACDQSVIQSRLGSKAAMMPRAGRFDE
jgi:hypothetical protein